VPPKLGKKHRAYLVRLVEEGPITAVNGVVRMIRSQKDLGFSHVSARPKAYKQDPDAMAAFKKTLPYAWRKSAPSSRRAHR
jgi:Winged helix-turn helix